MEKLYNDSRKIKIKSKKTSVNINMTEGSILKSMLMFFFPLLIGTFFQQLYNTVDAMIVGLYVGKEALSNVGGVSSMITTLVVGFFTGISTGSSVLVSQFYGAKNQNKLKLAVHTSYGFAIIIGIILGVLGILASPSLFRMMNTPEEIIGQSTEYINIYFTGLVFLCVYNMGAAILRAVGDSKRPLYLLAFCSLLNVVLDALFVIVFGWGVAGAAWATVISQALSAIAVTLIIIFKTPEIQLDLRKIIPNMEILKRMLIIGLPTGVETIMYSISNIIIMSAINIFGIDTIAAWSAYGKIDSIIWLVNSSFGVAIMTFVGQNYGAGKLKRIRKGVRRWLLVSIFTTIIISALILVFAKPLLGLFTTDSQVIDIGYRMMLFVVPGYFLFEFVEVLSGTLRAEGRVLVSSLIVLIFTCILRIVWTLVISSGKSLEIVILCYPITWGACAILMIFYYLWQQRRVEKEMED